MTGRGRRRGARFGTVADCPN